MNFTNFGIPNLFILNDWEIKKFLSVVLIIHTTLICLIFLESIGFEIPIIRPLVGFVYLTFIPGFLILRILGVNSGDSIENVLYAVGLSLSSLMFVGFVMNAFLPFFGIYNPISEYWIIFALNVFIILLTVISYFINKNKFSTPKAVVDSSSRLIVLLLFPCLAVIGTFILDSTNNNLLLLIQLILISVFPLLVALEKIPSKLHLPSIWAISISLLFHNSLPSMYPRLTDNVFEHPYASRVLSVGFWNSQDPGKLNAMLAITVVLPMFSEVCQLSLNSVFKVIVPFLYSLVPLALYIVFKKQTTEKIAFFSSFFFISFYEFFTWAGLTMKTVCAGLFLALFLMVVTNDRIKRSTKKTLLIIFSFSLAVSHYGTSYIFMFCLLATIFLTLLLGMAKYGKNKGSITIDFVILYFAFAIGWYIYTNFSPFFTFTKLFEHIVSSIMEFVLIPRGGYAYYVLTSKFSLSLEMVKILCGLSAFFSVIGVLNEFYTKEFNFNDDFKKLSLTFVGVGAMVFLGHLSGAATPDRIFHLVMFCLAPFCVIGGIIVFKNLIEILKIKNSEALLFSIFLVVFFSFNTGLVSELILKDHPGAPIYISSERIQSGGSIEEKEYFYREYVPICDTMGGKWLSNFRDTNKKIYADRKGAQILSSSMYGVKIEEKIEILKNPQRLMNESEYVYLRKLNTKENIFVTGIFPLKFFNVYNYLENKHRIYDNGFSEVWT